MRLETKGFIIMEPATGHTIPLFNSDNPTKRGTHVELSAPSSEFPRVFQTERSAKSFTIQWLAGSRVGTKVSKVAKREKVKLVITPARVQIDLPVFEKPTLSPKNLEEYGMTLMSAAPHT